MSAARGRRASAQTARPRPGLCRTGAARGRPFDPAGPRPRCFVDSLWGFLLEEPAPGRTRLIVSGSAVSRPRSLTAIADFLFWEPAHWFMQSRQFTNLKRRVERD